MTRSRSAAFARSPRAEPTSLGLGRRRAGRGARPCPCVRAGAAGLEMPAADPKSAERSERATGLIAATEAAQKWFAEQLQGLAGAEARAYLARRGIPDELARAFGLGFAPDARGKLKTALASL